MKLALAIIETPRDNYTLNVVVLEKTCVFNDRLKVVVLTEGSRRSSGSALNVIEPAIANARQPKMLRRCR